MFGEVELLLDLCLVSFVALEVELHICLFASGCVTLGDNGRRGFCGLGYWVLGYLEVGTCASGLYVQLSKFLATEGVDGNTDNAVALGGSDGERCLVFRHILVVLEPIIRTFLPFILLEQQT